MALTTRTPQLKPRERIIVALGNHTLDEAVKLAHRLEGLVGAIKVGTQMLYGQPGAPEVLRALTETGMPIMLDMKLADIPEVMQGSFLHMQPYEPWMVTIHTGVGRHALETMQRFVDPTILAGVTVLTSVEHADSGHLFGSTIEDAVRTRAMMASQSGLKAIVCSPQELAAVDRWHELDHLLRVVPGIRLSGNTHHDQVRVATPAGAVQGGADYLVIGRQITEADNPVLAVKLIVEDMNAVLA